MSGEVVEGDDAGAWVEGQVAGGGVGCEVEWGFEGGEGTAGRLPMEMDAVEEGGIKALPEAGL